MTQQFHFITRASLAAVLTLSSGFCPSFAQDQVPAPKKNQAETIQTLDQLLEKVRVDRFKDQQVNSSREKEFAQARDKQQSLLAAAKAALAAEQGRSESLKADYDRNEQQLAKLEEKLKLTMGTLGELFGVVRQVAGDAKGNFESSIVSVQKPDRVAFVDDLSRRKELASIGDLETLWYQLMTEMTESGKVVNFNSLVTQSDGQEVEKKVTRIGVFNLIADGHYLQFLPEVGKVVELGRQPQSRFLSYAEDFQNAGAEEIVPVGIDPSRGAVLSLLVQAPSLWERFQQGGVIGYVIIAVLLVGLLLVGERFFFLSRVSKQIKLQLASGNIDPTNPLGMIFDAFEKNRDKDMESLELKLDEAIIKGTSSVDRGLGTIKLFGAVAPLLGLLGTVTGMIATFQSITLFGTGDPKLMAGGISQALVTTVLGLVAAIPLLLLHSLVSSKSKEILSVLEEQSVGLLAQKSEEEVGA